MTNIVALPERRTPSLRRPIEGPVTAQILLFTGIRYERLEARDAKPAKRVPRVKNK